MKKQSGNIKVSKFIFWTPRILSIIFILFLSMFSLDVFENCNGFFQCSLALFIHNIPVFILIGVLIFSWRYEIVGAISFILAGFLYIVFAITRAETWQMVLLWICDHCYRPAHTSHHAC